MRRLLKVLTVTGLVVGAVAPGAAATTVSPAGAFTANGNNSFDLDTSTATVDCSAVTWTGSVTGTGAMTQTITFAACTESIFNTACTVGSWTFNSQIDGTGTAVPTIDTFTQDSSVSSTISCPSVGINCKVFATDGTPTPTGFDASTITDGSPGHIDFFGTVRTDGTAFCTAAMRAVLTIDSPASIAIQA
jgi:hypothetical protein